MLVRSVAASGRYAASLLALAAPAPAEEPAPASLRAPEPVVLWYRSTAGCPDGADFLARVGDRASSVRLAEAGDRVDFVVNLSMTPEAGARGRLERETQSGTVAIREVVDPSCERAADVVALNLALALDPERPAPGPVEQPTSAASTGSEPVSANEGTNTQQPLPRPAPSQVGSPPQPSLERTAAGSRPDRWRAGVQGGVLSGMSPELMGRGAAFLELGGALGPLLAEVTVRVAAVGAFGGADTDSGTVEQSLWAARLEVCPVNLGGPVVSLRPCGAGEVGQLRASHAHSVTASWGALGVHARGQWLLGSFAAVEAELGALFPLSRYEIVAGSSVLYRSAPAGVSTAIGVSIGF